MGLRLMPEASAAEFGPPPPPRRETRLVRLFIFIPLFLAGVATILFFLQGGYKGGKLHYDSWIEYLCLPGSLLVGSVPESTFKLVDQILVPGVVNSFLFGCAGLLVQLLRPHQKTSV
jgi:hypothetical protein